MPAIMLIVPTLQRGNVVLTLQRHLERAWQRLGQPRIHRKHLVALNKTGRWSVQGRVPTLERGNDQRTKQAPIRASGDLLPRVRSSAVFHRCAAVR